MTFSARGIRKYPADDDMPESVREGWFFNWGMSPNYRNRTDGPYETFDEARRAARKTRRWDWSTGRPYRRETDEPYKQAPEE